MADHSSSGTGSQSLANQGSSTGTDTVRTRSQTAKASRRHHQIEDKCLPPKKRHSSNPVVDVTASTSSTVTKSSSELKVETDSGNQFESFPRRKKVKYSSSRIGSIVSKSSSSSSQTSSSAAVATSSGASGQQPGPSSGTSRTGATSAGTSTSSSSRRRSSRLSSKRSTPSTVINNPNNQSSSSSSPEVQIIEPSASSSSASTSRNNPSTSSPQSATINEERPSTSSSGATLSILASIKAIAASHSASQPSSSSPSGSVLVMEPPSDNNIGGGASGGLSGLPSSSGTSSGTGDETDESEMGRLQALLEARGLPPHIFGVLGPRMQHLLHRSIGGNNSSTKAHELLKMITTPGADEGQQLQAVMEMCQLLVMGNEDTLSGFPIKQAVPALKMLLQMEHNFDIMNHAVRALTYMMESLPRSSAVVVEAVPVILEKLQAIQCMDVAEQSLTALEMLSRRHSKNILHAKGSTSGPGHGSDGPGQCSGVSSVLMYIDFFGINAQRSALAITANCFQNLTIDEFNLVKDNLIVLSNHLNSGDKKCIESICLAFSRIVDCFPNNEMVIKEVAGNNLLSNLQQLLLISPPLISTGTFVTVIRMMAIMCSTCPQLAVDLLKLDIAGTLRSLLLSPQSSTMSSSSSSTKVSNVSNMTDDFTDAQVELASRSPQEMYELVSLISELMPRLPSTGIFSVDNLLNKGLAPLAESIIWEWQDDRGLWHPYSCLDSKIIEAAHESGEDETSLSTMGRNYVIDYNSMQQINEESGTSRPIQRKVNSSAIDKNASESGADGTSDKDPRAKVLEEDQQLAQSVVKSLFGLLYEVYSSSAGPSVRQKCLRALLRIIHYSSSDLLDVVLKNHSVSRHISAMLASPDLRIVVGSLQMANILMEKLPEIFSIYFRREGVVHQVNKLTKLEPESPAPKVPIPSTSSLTTSSTASAAQKDLSKSLDKVEVEVSSIKTEGVPVIVDVPGPSASTSMSISPPAVAVDADVMFDYGLLPTSWPSTVPPPYELSPSLSTAFVAPSTSSTINQLPAPSMAVSAPSSSTQSPTAPSASRPLRSKSEKGRKGAVRNKRLTASTITKSSSSGPQTEGLMAPFGPGAGLSLIADAHSVGATSSLPPTATSATESGQSSSRRGSSRFTKVASSTSSFLASLHPGRWSRWSSSSSSSNNPSASAVNNPTSSASVISGLHHHHHVSLGHGHRGPQISSFAATSSSYARDPFGLQPSASSSSNAMSMSMTGSPRTGSTSYGMSNVNVHVNRDKIRIWIREEAIKFEEKYFSKDVESDAIDANKSSSTTSNHPALNTLNKLNSAVESLSRSGTDGDDNNNLEALEQLKNVLISGDISPFELIHSGVVRSLLEYLTKKDVDTDHDTDKKDAKDKDKDKKLDMNKKGQSSSRDGRIRTFLHVFIGAPIKETDFNHLASKDKRMVPKDTAPLSVLVMKLNACVSQLEQFPVRVHDIIGSVGSGVGSSSGRGTSALKFFNTHQLKVNLQRHADCNNLRQWRGGPVKIDPLALIQAIERYLVLRGYGRVRESMATNKKKTSTNDEDEDDEDEDDEDNDSDEEFDDNVAAMMLNQGHGRHRLQFFINDHPLPYNMTVYQAIRQFSGSNPGQQHSDHDHEVLIEDVDGTSSLSGQSSGGNSANIWIQTHAIHYKPYVESNVSSNVSTAGPSTSSSSASGSASTSKKGAGKGSKKGTQSSKSCPKDELWIEGKTPQIVSPIEKLIESKLTPSVAGNDSSFEAISLLRVLHGLNSHWNWFYSPSKACKSAISSADFINVKLTSKVNRQLQDPLVIMTGNLPPWLSSLAYSCPFLFPFETRHLLFYVTCFDRDRALQRLIDSTPGMSHGDNTERVTPRLDRRKKTVNRSDLLKQAESVLADVSTSGSNSKSLLEIQYENEVGTGLGPTLEFYSLVSQELQRADQEMWRGEVVSSVSTASKAALSMKSRASAVPSDGSSIVGDGSVDDDGHIEPVIKSQSKPSSGHLHVHGHLGHGHESKSDPSNVKYMFSPSGLFPVPLARNVKSATLTRIKNRYKLLGKFMAKALMDSRMIDIPLSVTFYKWLLGKQQHLSLLDMEHVDSGLSKTLIELELINKRKSFIQESKLIVGDEDSKHFLCPSSLTLDGCPVNDLGLDFTLPGFPNIELKKGGKDTAVTIDNLDQYVHLLCHWTLIEGVSKQMDSFKEGFESIFPLTHLTLFYPDELEQLFCGSNINKWDMKTLAEACHADHGYNLESRAIKWLFEILSNYDVEEQRKFLQFVTGSPRLPVGGLKSLTPPLTIVRKSGDDEDGKPDDYLPSVMTCVNYLKLPDYSSIEVMKIKLKLAAEEGGNSFHLS